MARLGSRAVALQADVTERGEVDRLVAAARNHFGQAITTVVNNALGDYRFIGDARPKAMSSVGGISRGSSPRLSKARSIVFNQRCPIWRPAKFGRIINIGTNLFQNPVVPYHDYTAAKAAVLSLTRTMAVELGPSGSR